MAVVGGLAIASDLPSGVDGVMAARPSGVLETGRGQVDPEQDRAIVLRQRRVPCRLFLQRREAAGTSVEAVIRAVTAPEEPGPQYLRVDDCEPYVALAERNRCSSSTSAMDS
jgi:hypothetical protein